LEEETGTRQTLVHIRIQQRTGRKTITTVQGIPHEYDLQRIVRYLKKVREGRQIGFWREIL
jgi:translation initiation factor 1